MRVLLLVLTMSSAVGSPPQAGFLDGVCHVSELVKEQPPDGSSVHASAAPQPSWYANPSRTIWAMWNGKTYTGAYKVLWFRTQGETITVTGQRLDGAAPQMTADMGHEPPLSVQGSGLKFPSDGCWRIDASAGGEKMSFVKKIP